jgi:hypothetical protein
VPPIPPTPVVEYAAPEIQPMGAYPPIYGFFDTLDQNSVNYVSNTGFNVSVMARSEDGLYWMYVRIFYPNSTSSLIPIIDTNNSSLSCLPYTDKTKKGCSNYVNYAVASRNVKINADVLKALPQGFYRVQATVRGWVSGKSSNWTDVGYIRIQNTVNQAPTLVANSISINPTVPTSGDTVSFSCTFIDDVGLTFTKFSYKYNNGPLTWNGSSSGGPFNGAFIGFTQNEIGPSTYTYRIMYPGRYLFRMDAQDGKGLATFCEKEFVVEPAGPPLSPRFGAITQANDGYSVQVENYDPTFKWAVRASPGKVAISNTGLITVSGITNNVEVTVYLVVSKLGYVDLELQYKGSSIALPPLIPTFDSTISEPKGFSVKILNYSTQYLWSATVSAGTLFTRYEGGKFNGWYGVTNLPPNTAATITITTTKNGHTSGSTVVSGTSP